MADLICPVCRHKRHIQFTGQILNKYKVNYIYCPGCGLLQTEKPYWLDEAYSAAISALDTGLVQRNLYNSRIVACLLYFLFDRNGKYLDVAGGCGMLTRLMRDIGFDYYWEDKYCKNILAKAFELSNTSPPFTAITAFEVLEHIYDPITFLRESFSIYETKSLIFSTELFKGAPPKPEEWWYYGFSSGQHVSFYQENTLRLMARELNLHFYTHGSVHLMTDKPIKAAVFRLLTNKYATSLGQKYVKLMMKSKTFSDSNHSILDKQL